MIFSVQFYLYGFVLELFTILERTGCNIANKDLPAASLYL